MKLKFFKEGGQALILIAFAALALFAITGLAIDGSNKYSDRRHAQNAADTAALAGALEKSTGMTNGLSDCSCPPASGSPSAFCQAILSKVRERTDQNGYNGDLTTNQVEVYSPPKSGPYTGQCSYVQVKITSYVDTYFTRVLGINQSTNIVEATAYAGKGGTLGDGAMLVSYDPAPGCSSGVGSGGGSFDITGSATVNLTDGGIFLNSNKTCGFSAPNCPNIQIAGGAGINSAGTTDNINQQDCTAKNPPIYPVPERLNQTPVVIPDDIDIPDEPPECNQLATAYPVPTGQDKVWHITPGYYSDFPQSNLNGDIVGNKKDIIMDPGVYCVGKSIHWSGSTFTSLDGTSGVTIYLKSGKDFDLSINSPITLYAPHSGSDYDGYIIIQDGTPANIGSCSMTGGTYLNLEGTVFTPYCNLKVNGGGDEEADINAQLIGWDITIEGNNIINFNYDPDKIVKIKRRVGLMK
jgi:hypothetical protein